MARLDELVPYPTIDPAKIVSARDWALTARVHAEMWIEDLVAYLTTNGIMPDLDTVETAATRVGRNHAPHLVHELHKARLLSVHVAAFTVPQAWLMNEYPMAALTAARWRRLFRHAGFTVDGRPAPRPDSPVQQLYRGATAEHKAGWSWTEDPDLAQRFATGGLGGRAIGQVWETLAPPVSVLAVMTGVGGFARDGEAEVVVDTSTPGLRIFGDVVVEDDS